MKLIHPKIIAGRTISPLLNYAYLPINIITDQILKNKT
jgi:hypothetical protein